MPQPRHLPYNDSALDCSVTKPTLSMLPPANEAALLADGDAALLAADGDAIGGS